MSPPALVSKKALSEGGSSTMVGRIVWNVKGEFSTVVKRKAQFEVGDIMWIQLQEKEVIQKVECMQHFFSG